MTTGHVVSVGVTSSHHSRVPHMVCMVTCSHDEIHGHEEAPEIVLPRHPARDMILTAGGHPDARRLGYAVIDTGATETVGSLDALEYIMGRRQQQFGREQVGIDVKRTKRLRFGNAQERWAESYNLLPQAVDGKSTTLGVYSLDVPGIPILLGVDDGSIGCSDLCGGTIISFY